MLLLNQIYLHSELATFLKTTHGYPFRQSFRISICIHMSSKVFLSAFRCNHTHEGKTFLIVMNELWCEGN